MNFRELSVNYHKFYFLHISTISEKPKKYSRIIYGQFVAIRVKIKNMNFREYPVNFHELYFLHISAISERPKSIHE